MRTWKTTKNNRLVGSAMLAAMFLAGCGAPSKVNIELRKQNQQLQATIDQLQRRHDADLATIGGLQRQATTVPILPESQLDQLFTSAGLQFGRLTGGYRSDPNESGDTMLKVYVVPIDMQGEPLKAAGTFGVELFDLALKSGNLIGQWNFDLAKARSDWYGQAGLYTYVLDCPWQTIPRHAHLMSRVTFNDALTHRSFTVDHAVVVQPPSEP